MFAKTEIIKPNYTIRMLLSALSSDKEGDVPKLKPFSHFTLACTHDNEASVADLFADLANYLQGPLKLTADEVVNLGTTQKPLWAVRLNLGENEDVFRAELSRLFDDIMSHEMNGVRYLWNPASDQETKCPHITIGFSAEDQQKANDLVDGHYEFTFERMDYKQVGPHNPHLIQELTTQAEETNTKGMS